MNQVFIPEWLVVHRGKEDGHYIPAASRLDEDVAEHDVLTRDVAFNRHSKNDGHHISPYDNNTIQVGSDNVEAVLVQGIDEENFRRVLSAATRATIGIDIMGSWEGCVALTEDPSDECEQHKRHKHDKRGTTVWGFVDPLEPDKDWEEMLKGGLQTALESQTIVFAVAGVSRTCTHQLVRSRRAAFHQQSQRASYMGDHPEMRMPESVWRKPDVRLKWIDAIMTSHAAYRAACEADISYQDARFILPEGTTNFIMLEYPVREFLNVYAYRACHMFQWEISAVMRECRRVLLDAHPWLEPYVKITCEKTKVCEFQGWEKVEGQCTLPWAKEDNRRFKPIHHRIG
jgi:flavin-dependent thymidylate synthase